MRLFPLFLDLTDKRVVIVGGGPVGQRKATQVYQAGGLLTIVDPALPASAYIISEPYRPEHIADAHLVFACATPEVNARVVADAAARRIWANAATDPDAGDIFLPAVVRSGDLTIAVSTGGASPALARRIREKLEAEFDDSFDVWVNLLAEMRPLVLSSMSDAERRRALLDDLADWRWLDRIRTDGWTATREAMLDVVRSLRDRTFEPPTAE
jgi:precorrin-2 dehydrogenase / sirohydrochlorin ferrochelatase